MDLLGFASATTQCIIGQLATFNAHNRYCPQQSHMLPAKPSLHTCIYILVSEHIGILQEPTPTYNEYETKVWCNSEMVTAYNLPQLHKQMKGVRE